MAALRLLFPTAVLVVTAVHALDRTIVQRAVLRGIDFDNGAGDSSVGGMNDDSPSAESEVTDVATGVVDQESDERWQTPPPQDESQPSAGVESFVNVDEPPPPPQQAVIRADPGDVAPELTVEAPPSNNVTVPAAVPLSDDPDFAGATNEESGGGPGDHVIAVAQVKAVQTAGADSAAATAKKKRKVLREFDDQAAEHDEFESQEALVNDEGRVRDGEQISMEDQQRLASGDISHTKRKEKRPKSRPLPRREPVAQPARHLRKKKHTAPMSLVGHKLSKTEEFHRAMLAARSQGAAQDRMNAQCGAFMDFMGGQDIKGSELIRTMKGTCDGAIREGVADMAFTVMCNSIGAEVEKNVMGPKGGGSWDGGAMCKAMLRVMNEAGVGK